MGNQNHGKMIDCQPERRLVELLSAEEIELLSESLFSVMKHRKGWGDVKIIVQNGKIKKIGVYQEGIPGIK